MSHLPVLNGSTTMMMMMMMTTRERSTCPPAAPTLCYRTHIRLFFPSGPPSHGVWVLFLCLAQRPSLPPRRKNLLLCCYAATGSVRRQHQPQKKTQAREECGKGKTANQNR